MLNYILLGNKTPWGMTTFRQVMPRSAVYASFFSAAADSQSADSLYFPRSLPCRCRAGLIFHNVNNDINQTLTRDRHCFYRVDQSLLIEKSAPVLLLYTGLRAVSKFRNHLFFIPATETILQHTSLSGSTSGKALSIQTAFQPYAVI